MIDDIALFVEITKQSGLANAAKSLNIPTATVTRRLQRLEERLGCRLIYRSARQFNLTSEGEAYYHAYAHLIEQFNSVSEKLNDNIHQLRGHLRVLAPTNISLSILQPMWSAFIQQYPDIQLELLLNNSNQNIFSTKADIALRIGPQTDSALYQKKLGSIKAILVAAPSYLHTHGEPKNVEDLYSHRLITVSAISSWQLIHTETQELQVLHPISSTHSNDVRLASQFCSDGIGISLSPVSEIQNELETGKLLQVLPYWRGHSRDIFAIWPSGQLLSARAKHLRKFMQDYIASKEILQDK